MGNIKEYTRQVGAPGPIETRRPSAEDFGAATFQGQENFGRAVTNVGEMLQKREEQSELSQLQVKVSEINAKHTIKWEETLKTADPNDKEVVTKFNEEFENELSAVTENINTRAGQLFFEKQSAGLKGSFLEATTRGQAELAGRAAKLNYSKSLDNYTTGLVSDPSSFGKMLQMHEDGLQAQMQSGMPRHVADQLRYEGSEKLALSAINGWIKLDPKGTINDLKNGKWDTFIDGEKKRVMLGRADEEISGRLADEERARAVAERAKKAAQEDTQKQFLDMLEKDELTWEMISKSNLDGFGSGSREQFRQMMKAKAERPPKTDPATFRALYERINLPDGDPKKITSEAELNEYVIRGSLQYDDLNNLRDEIQGTKTTEGKNIIAMKKKVMDAAEAALVKKNNLTGISDPIGEENMLRFQSLFFAQYKELKKAGKSDIELLDPDSKDYLGKHIVSFRRTPQQQMQDQVKILRQSQTQLPNAAPIATPPPPEPRKAGETAAEYIRRIKNKGG